VKMLVTGGAGFIGSHLVDALLAEGHVVVVLDDLSTGRRDNVHPDADLLVASVTDIDAIAAAMTGTDTVFHLAALGAVSRSVADPVNTNRVNGEGTLNALLCARDAGVRRFVLASSSSVYGGADVLPIAETVPTRPRSPYAVSKLTAEWHTRVVGELFELETIVLRYFNVFGPRQRPDAAYAAVIPRFAAALMQDERPVIYGDGHQSRDFTFVGDVVAANLAAAAAPPDVSGSVLNVAPGESHDLLELLDLLARIIGNKADPHFEPSRPGDIVSSRADASAAGAALGWYPQVDFAEGLTRYVEWLRSGSTR
jgi:UDP-N-acetylglucosamine/UDP-N-acetyl-alpha-D-glucosaminouronate 4-epimerase